MDFIFSTVLPVQKSSGELAPSLPAYWVIFLFCEYIAATAAFYHLSPSLSLGAHTKKALINSLSYFVFSFIFSHWKLDPSNHVQLFHNIFCFSLFCFFVVVFFTTLHFLCLIPLSGMNPWIASVIQGCVSYANLCVICCIAGCGTQSITECRSTSRFFLLSFESSIYFWT